MNIRKKYRIYFSTRKLVDLVRLVLYLDVPFQMKLHYIKEHIVYVKKKYRI